MGIHSIIIICMLSAQLIPYSGYILRVYKLRGMTIRKVSRIQFSRNSSLCSMHACDIKFVGINVRGTCLISENHKHLYP